MSKLKSKYYRKLTDSLEENHKYSMILLEKLKKDYNKLLSNEILDLLQKISQDYDLDYNELKEKYSKKKKKLKNKIKEEPLKNSKNDILDRIILEGKTYFVNNNIANGKIYDEEANEVGTVDGNNYIIDP